MRLKDYDEREKEAFREWQNEAIQILLLGGIGLALLVIIGMTYVTLVRAGVLMV